MTYGFINVKKNPLIEKGQDFILAALDYDRKCLSKRSFTEDKVKNLLARFFYEQTHRRPIIIPVTVEVGELSMEKHQALNTKF